MEDITRIIVRAIGSIVVILIVRYLWPAIKVKIAGTWMEHAVYAMQQTHGSDPGEDKKQKVLDSVKQVLKDLHISVSDELLDTLLEAAVHQMKIEEGRA